MIFTVHSDLALTKIEFVPSLEHHRGNPGV
jgi:hypothetical protein